MRTKGSKTVTKARYEAVKQFQGLKKSEDHIFKATRIAAPSQRRIAKSPSWEDWQRLNGARALKKRTTAKAQEVRTKAAVKKIAIEQNTKRKAQQIAVRHAVDINRLSGLEKLVQAQGQALQEQRAVLEEIKDLAVAHYKTLKRLARTLERQNEEDKFAEAMAKISPTAPIRPWWKVGGKR